MADDIEVSYHAAGIICHILSDDPDVSIWSATEQGNDQPDDGERIMQPTDGVDMPMMDDYDSSDEAFHGMLLVLYLINTYYLSCESSQH